MALKSPLMPSQSAFSPYTDSPGSPSPFHSSLAAAPSRTSATSDQLQPPQSPYPQFLHPSPVDSNGTASTEATDIEDDAENASPLREAATSPRNAAEPAESRGAEPPLAKIDVSSANRIRADSENGPQSVIHVPASFTRQFQPEINGSRSTATPSPTDASEHTVVLPSEQDEQSTTAKGGLMVSSLDTSVSSDTVGDRPTPRAHSVQELEDDGWKNAKEPEHLNLEEIPENMDTPVEPKAQVFDVSKPEQETESRATHADEETQQTIATLKNALSECWTLCNTLQGLSSMHRHNIFNYQGKTQVQETAWRSCWKLCQNLYESRNEDHATHVLPTLEMCRDFCQALFEARQRYDETAVVDSVLRVSFELNNHLYNAHDRSLPLAFQERTLDFYLTLCHRLMKQRTSLPEETDSLLRACWTLAEMLFSLRQNNRDGKPADEELLGSAVQACWDLCDLFRDGWTQIRPERGTPRAAQNAFAAQQHRDAKSRSERSSSHHSSSRHFQNRRAFPPETPTTIFDDSNDPMDEVSDQEAHVPNIMVLGPEISSSHTRWSPPSASSRSTHSDPSRRSDSMRSGQSSTTIGQEDSNISRIYALLVQAAYNAGYILSKSAAGSPGTMTLKGFVKTMPSNSFGTASWQMNILDKYKKVLLADPLFRGTTLPSKLAGKTTNASDIGRSVQWLMRSEQYVWLRDLFRMVFGCHPEDAKSLQSISVLT